MKTEVKNNATTARTSRRSAFTIMLRLVGLVRPLAGFMILAILMGVLGNLAATFISIFGAYALLSAMGFASSSPMALLFGGMLLFALVRGLLRYAEQECNHFIAFKLLALIRDRVFTALRKLAPAKLEVKNKGNLMSVITSDIELLEVFYAHTISPICIAVMFCVVMVWFIVSSTNWILSVIALVSYLVVGVAIPLAMSKRSEQDSAEARDLAGKLSTATLDNLRGLDEILQYNTGAQMIEKTSQLADQLSDRQQAVKKAFGVNDAVTSTVILLSGLVMFFSSFYLAYNQQILMTDAIIATIALMSSFGPVVALAALGTTLTSTFAAGNRVLDILDEKPLVEDVVDQKDISYEGVRVSELSFAYDNEQILDNISVDIPTDKIVGIVGKSGSGKSTLLKLLMHFWPATPGAIEISGTPLEQINTSNLRDLESYMTQDTHLYHDSIKNNLRIAKLDATDEEIIEACKKASIHEYISTLPQGYDTPVAELGDSLSGGERQRIGLARAFLHDAPLMLLDEPTSNLDSLNEAIILRSLDKETERKSVVLVSHRASTMGIADVVYTVDGGRVS